MYIIEVCGRGGGGQIVHPICKLVSNVDAAHNAALVSVGKSIFFNPEKKDCVVWRFFHGPPGTIKKVSGIIKAKNIPGIISIELLKSKGIRLSL